MLKICSAHTHMIKRDSLRLLEKINTCYNQFLVRVSGQKSWLVFLKSYTNIYIVTTLVR
jgi:hypothetical protein